MNIKYLISTYPMQIGSISLLSVKFLELFDFLCLVIECTNERFVQPNWRTRRIKRNMKTPLLEGRKLSCSVFKRSACIIILNYIALYCSERKFAHIINDINCDLRWVDFDRNTERFFFFFFVYGRTTETLIKRVEH